MNNEKKPEQIAAEEKALAIIKSCTMCEHFKNATQYIELFHKQFKPIRRFSLAELQGNHRRNSSKRKES